jgi:cell division protein FtsI (penicillin-binding protein 3)
VLSDKTVKQLREILEGVVEEGTAQNLKTAYLKIAGKTGTAVISNHGYTGNKKYQASFVGYFPADDPQYTMIVVVNSPGQGGYYGNVVAGSVFREVADKVYSLSLDMHPIVNDAASQNIPPVVQSGSREDISTLMNLFGVKVSEQNDEWIKLLQNNSKQYVANDIKADIVPDVVGMGLKDAIYLLESRGMHVQFNGRGNVKGQSIDAGSRISKGEKITIQLS